MSAENKMDDNGVSRRQIMIGAGAMAAGAAVAHFGGLLTAAQAKGGSTETWPWPYVKLDPATTAQIAYEEWYRVFCGAAVINSVFAQLREKVGEPYKSFPADAFVFLEGGQVGWGTVCGSPLGANIVANCIIGPRIAGDTAGHQITDEIMQWYSEAAMPVFMPKNPKITTELVKTTSNSPLCHISVGKWMKAANKPIGSAERKDRCARVAASTAFHLVELLNDWKDGKYVAKATHAPVKDFGITSQMNCMECHGSNIPTPPLAKK
ncbi:MAG: chain A iron centre cytochrome C protein [Deltaproteobacteria bacterium RIFOXYD12_FULL_55_16]|nr:MAG: chain A iron centre cytochrome C protein [Deltaproteobacteria bacterium RIFOXYD12_FULL_55_16]